MLQRYKKIMVAVDGSSESELAFQKAIAIALRNDAHLLLAHVIDTRAFQSVSSFDGVLAEQATSMAKESLNDYKETAKNHGCKKIATVIEYGSPRSLLAKQLPQENAIDLILIGATGLNAVELERLFIGSVSEYVVRHATCDVLVVRTDLKNEREETASS